ncbi:MAG TPA: hypothetical protein ENN06_10815 [Desulfobacteraceae bacterium]|nr:hypothetical protein [Desulfobacteraceae bacterium]
MVTDTRHHFSTSCYFFPASLVGVFLLLMDPALGAIQGPCDGCHTMHNSQNNLPMNYSNEFDQPGRPNDYLLRASCLGCHAQGGNALEIVGSTLVPQVYHTELTKNLAGGNFYYVRNESPAKGHNIGALTGTDDVLLYPPGGIRQTFHFGPGDLVTTENLTCASMAEDDRGGCHGNRSSGLPAYAGISGAHHDNRGGGGPVDPAGDDMEPGHSYRFLLGVRGYEAADWEYDKTITSHNEYFGLAEPIVLSGCANADNGCHGAGGVRSPDGTISQFCATCHGNFHTLRVGSGNDTTGNSSGIGEDAIAPFIRHPTDLALPATGEYASYTTYSLEAPVARPEVYAEPSSTVTPGRDIVMCLSCHYSHGSEYDDMLRWSYSTMIAGNGGAYADTGCFVCHSTKD